ncbi:MAG: type II secretion system protein [Armatimonadota bacterium]|nr:type II secretion system protein [Armatimonadota bacterium]
MNRRDESPGFTLIEIVVTLAILGLVATGVMGGLLSAMAESRRGFDRAQAVAWVQSELDFLRIQGYGIAPTATPRRIPDPTHPDNDPATGYLPNYGDLEEPRIPPGFYQAEVEVSEVSGLPLKRLAVRLYQRPGSPPYTILVTYVSRFETP